MTALALYLIKVTLCSAVLYAYYYACLRNRVFHQYNRFYLLAAVVFSLVFPLIPIELHPAAPLADGWYGTLNTSGSEVLIQVSSSDAWQWQHWAALGYGLVAALLVARMGYSLWQIGQMARKGKVQVTSEVSFVLTNHPSAPFSFFRWLFWQQELPLDSDSGERIFRHELVHIREHHTLDKLLLQATLALFWINPVFWIIRRELQLIHEFIADRRAAADGGTEALAEMILRSVYGRHANQLINPFFQQPIKRRLVMLQKTLQQPRNAWLGRVLALPLAALLLFIFARYEAQAQTTGKGVVELRDIRSSGTDTIGKKAVKNISYSKSDTVNHVTIEYQDGTREVLTKQQAINRGLASAANTTPMADALLIIDGQVLGLMSEHKNTLAAINPSDILSMNVWKDKQATDRYGNQAAGGAIEITTKKNSSMALLIIDGVEKGRMQDFQGDRFPVKSENMASMNVLSEKQATDKYGAKGKNGVVEIVTRKTPAIDPVFEKAEQMPRFPGGDQAWRQFLQQHLNPGVPVVKGAPAGTYTTVTEMIVAADGTVTDMKALTNHGYGMEEEVLRALKLMPRWEPARQNGRTVAARHKQPVTFVIADEDASQRQQSGTNHGSANIRFRDPSNEALLVIDGVEKGLVRDFYGDKFPVKIEMVESINILKDKEAITKYGEKGKHGVIELITHQAK